MLGQARSLSVLLVVRADRQGNLADWGSHSGTIALVLRNESDEHSNEDELENEGRPRDTHEAAVDT